MITIKINDYYHTMGKDWRAALLTETMLNVYHAKYIRSSTFNSWDESTLYDMAIDLAIEHQLDPHKTIILYGIPEYDDNETWKMLGYTPYWMYETAAITSFEQLIEIMKRVVKMKSFI